MLLSGVGRPPTGDVLLGMQSSNDRFSATPVEEFKLFNEAQYTPHCLCGGVGEGTHDNHEQG